MEYNEKSFAIAAERIRCERKRLRFSQEKLLEKLSSLNVGIGRNRLSMIENGVRDGFGLDPLIAMCSVFNCDLGYLMGDYSEKTKDAHDICNMTGLTEDALWVLMDIKKRADAESAQGWSDSMYSQRLQTISFLLTAGQSVIDILHDCIWGDYQDFLVAGEVVDEVWAHKRDGTGETAVPIDAAIMKQLFYRELQSRVERLEGVSAVRVGRAMRLENGEIAFVDRKDL